MVLRLPLSFLPCRVHGVSFPLKFSIKCMNMKRNFQFQSPPRNKFSSSVLFFLGTIYGNRQLSCYSQKNIYSSEICLRHYQKELERSPVDVPIISPLELGNFRYPSKWFPEARKMKRKIIAHLGPTNSGKTFTAMNAFKSVKKGIYCSPLRLLAIEKYEQLNSEGLKCALITGEAIKGPRIDFDNINMSDSDDASVGGIVDENDELSKYGYTTPLEGLIPTHKQHPALEKFKLNADFIACTVEMVDLHTTYDMAIIDEIQMMADDQRGWAFTHAFLGIQANEIHVCGDPVSLPLLKALCKETGDVLEIKTYNRLAQLNIGASLDCKLSEYCCLIHFCIFV